ncbi:polynucleotide adenylyltransferase PcnB [Candidatus Vallotiella sp. (ex Adelges kitamiensis)]|uniref:polynucleotide adenylyltransferase PcnB n=1 Tax=Candidatus Vallotiella sp. (ex Adelges kitamiensis) TaxID=2864217 RepID=UPI001CE2C227|nr:polynucleotide adenylyltransferase PcnB [Candidatus Vallotia sp. (ex Adelges kitamiensis)]
MITKFIRKLFSFRRNDSTSPTGISRIADVYWKSSNINLHISLEDCWRNTARGEQYGAPAKALSVRKTRLLSHKSSCWMLCQDTLAVRKYTESYTTARGKTKVPVIVSADVHHIDLSLISRNAIHVTNTLQKAGFYAFIVGGAVRDLLLNIAPKDFDVATDATPDEVIKLFRRARLIGRRFQIVHVQFGLEIIEVSTFRALMDITPDNTGQTMDSDLETLARKRRCSRSNWRMHTIDASGRVLRDNVWGEQHEDAMRRDFTVNSMYYDPSMQTVLDYHHGMDDIQARILRMIGEPATRFREDPIRMLRVVRFAAKLDFIIELSTQAPLAELADLINNIPAARLFDEMLKLLLSGHAVDCLRKLRALGLHHRVLPFLDIALAQPIRERFIMLALTNTDERVRAGKRVSPGFLFASLLWHEIQLRWQQHEAGGEHSIPALHRALDAVLNQQTKKLAIQRRYTADMREILELQPRLEKRSGRSALKILEHKRFRAGYDFLLLRCASGELDPTIGRWWEYFITSDSSLREVMLAKKKKMPAVPMSRKIRSS